MAKPLPYLDQLTRDEVKVVFNPDFNVPDSWAMCGPTGGARRISPEFFGVDPTGMLWFCIKFRDDCYANYAYTWDVKKKQWIGVSIKPKPPQA